MSVALARPATGQITQDLWGWLPESGQPGFNCLLRLPEHFCRLGLMRDQPAGIQRCNASHAQGLEWQQGRDKRSGPPLRVLDNVVEQEAG